MPKVIDQIFLSSVSTCKKNKEAVDVYSLWGYNVPGTASAFCRCMAGRSNKKPSWLRYLHYISMQQHILTYLKQHSRYIFFYPTRQCKLLLNYILVFVFHGLYTCFHHCPSCGGYGPLNIRAPSHLPTISIMPFSVPVGPTRRKVQCRNLSKWSKRRTWSAGRLCSVMPVT